MKGAWCSAIKLKYKLSHEIKKYCATYQVLAIIDSVSSASSSLSGMTSDTVGGLYIIKEIKLIIEI